MSDKLRPSVEMPPPSGRWWKVLLICIGAPLALYLLAAVLIGVGLDGY